MSRFTLDCSTVIQARRATSQPVSDCIRLARSPLVRRRLAAPRPAPHFFILSAGAFALALLAGLLLGEPLGAAEPAPEELRIQKRERPARDRRAVDQFVTPSRHALEPPVESPHVVGELRKDAVTAYHEALITIHIAGGALSSGARLELTFDPEQLAPVGMERPLPLVQPMTKVANDRVLIDIAGGPAAGASVRVSQGKEGSSPLLCGEEPDRSRIARVNFSVHRPGSFDADAPPLVLRLSGAPPGARACVAQVRYVTRQLGLRGEGR